MHLFTFCFVPERNENEAHGSFPEFKLKSSQPNEFLGEF